MSLLNDVALRKIVEWVNGKLLHKADKSHTHTIANVNSLQSTLDSKAATNHTHSAASSTTNGFLSKEDKVKLDGIEAGANKFTMPSKLLHTIIDFGATGISFFTPEIKRSIDNSIATKADAKHTHVTADIVENEEKKFVSQTWINEQKSLHSAAGERLTEVEAKADANALSLAGKANSSHNHNLATQSAAGFLSPGDKTKIDGIPSSPKYTDTTYALATTSTAGLLSNTDKIKLDAIPANPKYTDTNTITTINGKTGAITKADIVALGIPSTDTNTTYSPVTTTTNGLMLAADKAKLDNIPTDAKYTDTITTINGKTGAITKADIVALGIPATDTNTVYTHPTNHPASIITQDANNRFVTDAEKSAWNNKANASHTHTIANITNLQTELDKRAGVDGKASGPWQIGKKIYNVANCLFAGTPTEILIKTGIPFISGAHMPVIHIEGYAYGLQSPIELKIGYYVYDNQHGWAGAVSMGAWRPTIKLFTYLVGTTKYTGIALIGSIYFPQFAVHVHTEKGESYRDGWSITSNSSDNTVYHMPDTDVYTIPYKATFSQKINGVTFDGTSDITITASANGGNSDTVDGKHASDFALASQVKTNVPVGAKFTDTITTINGKTGAITKADITALGIPAQDTVVDISGKADKTYVDNKVKTDVPVNAKFTDTVYTHPTTHPASMITGLPTSLPANGGNADTVGGFTVGVNVPANAKFTDTNTTYAAATTTTAGLMSAADKVKLNGIAANANETTVVDTLTSTSTTSALSANQGRLLNSSLSGKANAIHEHENLATKTELSSKVDKVTGKGLSTNDYTTTAKEKVDTIPASPKYTDTVTTINGKTGAITKSDITALGIPAQDTVYTHPSTHPASMITESTTKRFVTDNEKFAWNSKVDKAGGQMTGELVAQPSGDTRQARNIAIGTTAPTSTTGYSEGDIFLVVP